MAQNPKRILFDSEEGHRRIKRALLIRPFLDLQSYYDPQVNPYYCAVACTALLLNFYSGKRKFQQTQILNATTDRRLKNRRVICSQDSRVNGFTLVEMVKLLRYYRLRVRVTTVEKEKAVHAFRRDLTATLKQEKRFLIANFHYPSFGISGEGHFAPVVAYDKKSDSVLLLDVALHKTGWWWTKVEHLYQGMHTRDGDQWRGYLVVSRS